MRSAASTVDAYLADLAPERRRALAEVRGVILANLPSGYEEARNWGMITYQVPLERHRDTYNGQPLMYAALASQKHHMAVYLTGIYSDDASRHQFLGEYRSTGKRLDTGKSCVRFRTIDDLPLDVIGRAIAAWDVDAFIAMQEQKRSGD